MPVVAVAAAAVLDIGAAGALAAGTLTTLSAITAIGATVGAVGAVTGNKTLSMVGAGLGIVGAVGTLASGAGIFDNVSDLFNSSSAAGAGAAADAGADTGSLWTGSVSDLPGAAATGAADTGAETGTLWTGNTTDLAGAINSTPSLASSEGDTAAIVSGNQPGPLSQALSPSATSSTESSTLPGATDTAATSASSAAPPPASLFQPGGAMKAASLTTPDQLNAAAGIYNNNFGAGATGLLGWAKDNQLVTYGAIQAGGAFISGLTNPMTPAQINALNAQANQNNATAALLQKEAANQNQPIPVASSSTVTGKVEMPSGGLINTKPVASPIISGANTGATA